MNIHYRGLVAFVVIPGFVAVTLALSTGTVSVSASERSRQLRVTKECSHYTGAAGSFCSITSSNVPEIKVGSKVFYDQAGGIPTGMLDSNVILDAGNGDKAIGRCTLDFAAASGLCTFTDGLGRLAGFHARVDVSSLGGADWAWRGTYGFSQDEDKDRER
jgi:hypothetical protein